MVILIYLNLILRNMINILFVISDQFCGQYWITVVRTYPVQSVSGNQSLKDTERLLDNNTNCCEITIH